MAHFAKVPDDVLKHIPGHVSTEVKDLLLRSGTYSLFKNGVYGLKVPVGNNTWKGPQARLVGVWGGGADGKRLDVTVRDPSRLTVTLVSEKPVAPHLWAYIVEANEEVHRCPATYLEARNSAGGSYAEPLPVDVLNQTASSPNLGTFQGGDQNQTRDAIIAECQRQGLTLDAQIAYVLATVQHESSFTPIREAGYLPDPRGERVRRGFRYYPYYGRGYVQLTWAKNYKAYAGLVGGDLVDDPDLALQPAVAVFVLVHGMKNGTFGAKVTKFIDAKHTDFPGARHSVNGTDKAAHIASLAEGWLKKLKPLLHAAPVGPAGGMPLLM